MAHTGTVTTSVDEAAATVRKALKALPCIGVGADGLTYGPDYVAAVAALDVLVAAAARAEAVVAILQSRPALDVVAEKIEAVTRAEAAGAERDRLAGLVVEHHAVGVMDGFRVGDTCPVCARAALADGGAAG
jgi:hypothetical protein